MDRIQVSELSDWVLQQQQQGRSVALLDVREPWELEVAQAQVPGAEFRPVPMHLVPLKASEWSQDQAIACLCHHGVRSLQVALFLKRQGFAHIANVDGGIDAWANLPGTHIPRY